MVASTLMLFAFDVVLRAVLNHRSPNLWLGLGLALAVFSLVFWVVFSVLSRLLLGGAPKQWLIVPLALLSAAGFVVGLPLYVVSKRDSNGPPIRSQVAIPGRIDLVLVAPGPHRGALSVQPAPQPAELAAWDVRYTVAVPSRHGSGLEFLVAGTESRDEALRVLRSGRPLETGIDGVPWRSGAQRAVVLDVDRASLAAPPAADRLAREAAALDAPTFALLGPDASGGVAAWEDWTGAHRGEAGNAADLEGPTPLDASLRLVAESRTMLADRQLAYAYRPMLLFDKSELYDWPVDVGSAFTEGAVQMCKHGQIADECEAVKNGADLDQSFAYLKFDPTRFGPTDREERPQAIGSAYYYHVAHRPSDPHIYIDYWWYMPYNPSLTGWMCSPGFSVVDFDCFDHESDWEGITVKVGKVGEPPPAVFYAQHNHVIRQTWGELRRGWKQLKQDAMVEAEGAHHPLVFVARASHASYPYPCSSDLFCFESNGLLPEGHYAGESAWSGDEDETCAAACLKPLPITREGGPASWNAFSGPWGTQTCIVNGTFCDRGEAPHSPAFQPRYENPGRAR